MRGSNNLYARIASRRLQQVNQQVRPVGVNAVFDFFEEIETGGLRL